MHLDNSKEIREHKKDQDMNLIRSKVRSLLRRGSPASYIKERMRKRFWFKIMLPRIKDEMIIFSFKAFWSTLDELFLRS